MQFSNRATALSTLTKDKPQQHHQLAERHSIDRTATEPVAIVLPHTIVDLRRPTFLSNARIHISSLEPSIVQEPEVRIVFDETTTTTTLPGAPADKVVKRKKTIAAEVLPWQPSPIPVTDVGALLNKYLMLSKFRLTCE